MLLLIALLLQVTVQLTPAGSEEPMPVFSGPQRGMWVWHFQTYSTQRERERLIEFCRSEKITLLLVQVHYRLNPETDDPIALRNPEAYGDLIEAARNVGITVEALEGDPHWTLPSERNSWWVKFKVIMDWYDAQPLKRRFAGLHLDVEPYLLEDFDTTKKWEILRQYVEFMAQVREALKKRAPELLFAADIPFWYDNVLQEDEFVNHNVVEFNGVKKPVSFHILDLCDYIGIMSYRRQAFGENSITQLCKEELAYAEKIGKKIFAGVEMSPDQDPPTISFYGTDVDFFRGQINLVDSLFGHRKGFGGILIHYYNTYAAFLGEPLPEMAEG